MLLEVAQILRILVMKTFVDVDQMHNVLGIQIRVTTGRADVVRMMNVLENNIVTMDNAKVRHCSSQNLIK